MRMCRSAWLTLALWLPCLACVYGMPDERRMELQRETQALFRHGYDGYMKYAYPADELRPLTCGPLHRDPDPANFGVNDIHANVSMTLLDTLSSLPLLHPSAFPKAVELVAERVSFDQDVKVQVFEMTIRALGALLSTYQLLDDLPEDPAAQALKLGLANSAWTWTTKKAQVDVRRYKDKMLALALDLGERMLPAFETPTGIPYARVNLRSGVVKGETVETCAAGAGSLVLEFSLLSRLTGDNRFETLAHNAFMAIWNRRTEHNLVGNTIGATHGQWLAPGMTGVGAGIDSFYEYAIKAGIMLDDDTYYDIFHDAYAAIQTHIRTTDGFIYRPIFTRLLQPASPSTIDSLSAFVPGMQVLAGDIESAIKSHLVFWNLWRKHSAMPESWVWAERRIEWNGYPGRPEFIESTYYLYQATRDPFYLRVGERILADLKRRTRTKCGFATLRNVMTGEMEDRMESFMLSETLKYLYLLFSDTPFPNANKVFTTEGHPLRMPSRLLRAPSAVRKARRLGENHHCPRYQPATAGGRVTGQGIVIGIEGRNEYEYARALVYGWDKEGLEVEDWNRMWWPGGTCRVPTVAKFAFEIVLTPSNGTDGSKAPPEDPSPGLDKVHQDSKTGDYIVTNIDGLRLGVRWRFDGTGYDVANIGPHRIRQGQSVVIVDPAMQDFLPVPSTTVPNPSQSPPEVILRFSLFSGDPGQPGNEGQVFLHAVGATSTFGKVFKPSALAGSTSWELGGKAIRLVVPPETDRGDEEGCEPIHLEHQVDGPFVLLLARGNCTFLEKVVNAQAIGAIGVLVIGTARTTSDAASASSTAGAEQEWEEGLIRPSADESDPTVLASVVEMGVVYTEHVVGEVLRRIAKDQEEVTMAVDVTQVDASEIRQSVSAGEADSSQASAPHPRGSTVPGQLRVGEHAIWNLRVVDATGQVNP
ncbi:hypothetical protein IAU60_000302 [Kwoniella sp. DSM 27419]